MSFGLSATPRLPPQLEIKMVRCRHRGALHISENVNANHRVQTSLPESKTFMALLAPEGGGGGGGRTCFGTETCSAGKARRRQRASPSAAKGKRGRPSQNLSNNMLSAKTITMMQSLLIVVHIPQSYCLIHSWSPLTPAVWS